MNASEVTVVMGTIPGREDMRRRAKESVYYQKGMPPVPLIVTIDREQWGCGWAKNGGLRLVETPWTAFLDDDDWYYPGHLRRLLDASADADLVYSRPHIIHDGKREAWPPIPFDPDQLWRRNYIPCGYMVRTALAREVGGFPERTPEIPYSDWGFLLRLLEAGARFAYVPEVTWAFRRWSGNTSSWRTVQQAP